MDGFKLEWPNKDIDITLKELNNGCRYFTKNGLTLSDLRDRIENEESDED